MPLSALIFDVDGTLADTEDAHRKALNTAFTDFGFDWQWDRDLYTGLLTVTGGRARIRHFIESAHAEMLERADIDDLIADLHKCKTGHYVKALNSGGVPLRPGVERVLRAAKSEPGLKLAIATTTTPVNIQTLIESYHLFNETSEESIPLNITINSNLFPTNISELSIKDVLVHFTLDDPESMNDIPVTLSFNQEGDNIIIDGGEGIPINGTISTARGNAGKWVSVRNNPPFGEWIISLPNSDAVKTLLKNESIKDILLVVTYDGETHKWPQ